MATRAEVEGLSVSELKEYLVGCLNDKVQEESIAVLERNRVSGETFLELDDEDIREMFPLIGERRAIKRAIEDFKPKQVPKISL